MSDDALTEPPTANARLLERLRARLSNDNRPRWRHVKRGTVYVELGRGCLQTGRDDYLDAQEVVIYQAETGGQTWVRPTYEFMDGRFESVPSAKRT